MLDSQKLSAESFLIGFKHGLYVITNDSCQICADYKKDIEYINNCYLYFVEVSTNIEKQAIYQIADRTVFPLTLGFVDNELKFVKVGQLFGEDLSTAFSFFKQFGEAPLSSSEISKKIDRIRNKCILSFYLFPEDTTIEQRNKEIEGACARNELPIDIDSFNLKISIEDKERMFETNLATAKLIVYDIEKTDRYSELGMKILTDYVAINKNTNFIKRSL